MKSLSDESRRPGNGMSLSGEPVAGKLARRVRRGEWGNTVRLCALLLPYEWLAIPMPADIRMGREGERMEG